MKEWESHLMINIKAFLIANDISILFLSNQTGISERTLYNWTAGKCFPKTDWRIKALADFMGVTVDLLCYSKIATFGKVIETQKKADYHFNTTNRVPTQLDIFGVPEY